MAYADEVMADTPSLYWKFNETSGTTVADASGNSMSGTYSGGTLGQASLVTTDSAGKSYQLNGTAGNYAYRSSNTLLQVWGYQAFTIEAWIKPTTISGTHWIVGKQNSTGGYGLWQNGSTLVFRRYLAGGGTQSATTASGVLAVNGVYHVVAVYTGASSGTGMYLYVNGSQVASATVTTTTGDPEATTFAAGSTGGGASVFTGYIDEVAFYKTALSTTRISAHYAAAAAQGTTQTVPAAATFTTEATPPSLNIWTDISLAVEDTGTTALEATPPDVTVTSTISLEVPLTTGTYEATAPTVLTGTGIEVPTSTVAFEATPADRIGLGWTGQVSDTGTFTASATAPTIAEADQGYIDFSTYSSNAQPAGWTKYGTGTFKVQTTAGATGGKTADLIGPSGGMAANGATWDVLGTRSDLALQTSFRYTVPNLSGADYSNWVLGIVLRRQVDGSHYVVGIRNQGNRVGIYKVSSAGVPTLLATSATKAGATVNPSLAVQIEDDTIKAKHWVGSEGAAWDVEYTDPSPLGAGTFGLGGITDNGETIKFDTFEFGDPILTVDAVSRTLNWQVLPAITVQTGLTWKVVKEVTVDREVVWNTGTSSTVDVEIDLSWNTIGEVEKTSDIRWNTLVGVTDSATLRWHDLNAVPTKTRDLRWSLLQSIGTKTRDLRWDVLRSISTSREIEWAQDSEVTKTTQARWVVNADDQVVLTSRLIPWNSLTTVTTKTASVRWGSALDKGKAAQHIIDFSQYALGALPVDWSAQNDDLSLYGTSPQPRNAWTIVARADAIGGKVLRGNPDSRYSSVVYWPQEPSLTDQDVTLRVQSAASFGFMVRTAGDYYQYNTRRYYLTVNKNGGVSVSKVGGGTISSTGASPAYLSNQWVWVRFQNVMAMNTTPIIRQVKAKVWLDGFPEPDDWNVVMSDSEQAFTEGSSLNGYYNIRGNFTITGPVDVDWIGWVQPNAKVTVPAPATFYAEGVLPSYGRSSTLRPDGPGRFTPRAYAPAVEIGDQVLVSWFQVEMPEPIRVVSEIFVDLLESTFTAPVPTLSVEKNHSVEVGNVAMVSVVHRAPFSVVAAQGAAPEAPTAGFSLMANAPEVTIRSHASLLVTTVGEATFQGTAPEVTGELNVRLEVSDPSDTLIGSLKPLRVNGGQEVEVGNVGTATVSMIVPTAIKATLTVTAPVAEVTTAAPSPDVRLSSRIVAPKATFSVVGTPVTFAFGIGIGAPLAQVTFVARLSTERMGSRAFTVPSGPLFEHLLPDVLAYFTKVHVSVGVDAPAAVAFTAQEPEYLFTPAEVGAGVTVYLGSLHGEVRLAVKKTDVLLGSTRASVVIAEVRDEVRA